MHLRLLLTMILTVQLNPKVCRAGVNPLDGLAEIRSERAMRASSADRDWRNGNGDARSIAPGETLVVADLKGSGVIRHIWFTISAHDKFFPRTTVLRVYWDGRDEPSVEAPLGDFFAVGHGMTRTVDTIPVQVSSEGRAYNCYWPMPFRRAARVTMTNDSTQPVGALYWYVDWVKVRRLPRDLGYFHAQYRQEYPCKAGEDYLILDTKGRGQYVGTVLSVQSSQAGWFGEGDDRFFIDGEAEPSLRGTGTEDYFCDAWGFREFNQPYHGVTVWEGFGAGDRGTAYRWHVADPVAFAESLRVTIEHKGAVHDADGRMISGFTERPDYFSSVAFWYQTKPAARLASIPTAGERVFPETVIEAEAFMEQSVFDPADAISVQDLGGVCSGGKQLFFTPRVPEASAEVALRVPESGEFLVLLDLVHSWDYGTYDVAFDGATVIEDLDLYSPTIVRKSHRIGVRKLEAGEHRIRFTCVGTNPESMLNDGSGPGYYLGVDAVSLRKIRLDE